MNPPPALKDEWFIKDKIADLIEHLNDLLELADAISQYAHYDDKVKIRNHYLYNSKVLAEMTDYYFIRHANRVLERIKIWTMIGKRLGLCKDMRNKISEEIYKQIRDDYDLEDEDATMFKDIELRKF